MFDMRGRVRGRLVAHLGQRAEDVSAAGQVREADDQMRLVLENLATVVPQLQLDIDSVMLGQEAGEERGPGSDDPALGWRGYEWCR